MELHNFSEMMAMNSLGKMTMEQVITSRIPPPLTPCRRL